MAHSPLTESCPDLAFFRNTGIALVIATLAAGTVTLSLSLAESRAIILAGDTEPKISVQQVAVVAAATLAPDAQE